MNLNNNPDCLNVPNYLKRYINDLEFAYTEAMKINREVAGKLFSNGMRVIDKLDTAIADNRRDEVETLEAELDAICGSKLQQTVVLTMLQHFASLYDALCVLEDLTLDEDGNRPTQVDSISTFAHELEGALMNYKYRLDKADPVSDNDDILMEE